MTRSGIILPLLLIAAIASHAQVNKKDSLALVALYNGTNGSSWTDNSNWLIGTVDTWFGISVNGSRVSQVQLSGNGLSGIIPSSIDSLFVVTDVNLSHNNLSGTVPVVSKMALLTNLDLSFNSLTGTLPASLGTLPNLSIVDFSSNNFSGAIPTAYGSLQNLGSFVAANNALTAVPVGFFGLMNLFNLDLSHNQIADSLRNNVYGLQSMNTLDLSFNLFVGGLPDSLFALTGLIELRLNNNQFSEDLPITINRLINLKVLHLQHNQFDCAIPSSLDFLFGYRLIDANFSFNKFTYMDNFSNIVHPLPINNNRLQFGDIETNLSNSLIYSPQDSVNNNQVVSVIQGNLLSLYTFVRGQANLYQWYRNGVVINGETHLQYANPSATAAEAGLYYCQITSSNVPGLTLYRKTIRVYVLPCGTKINQQDSLALVAVYNSTNGANWKTKTNWLTGNVSTWFGVTTQCDRVTQVDLNNNNLVGPLPSAIGNFSFLKSLKLYGNPISGTIPSAIGNLINLNSLQLNDAQLSGPLPAALGNLAQLQYLYLGNNQLTGSIPSSIETLRVLQKITLYNNQLTGGVESLCVFDQITHIDFHNNKFSGGLPEGITHLTNLIVLNLASNKLSGPLPIGLNKLTSVQNFALGTNHFSGTIPSSLSSMSSLIYLDLEGNKLTGDFPGDIGVGDFNLTYIYIGGNNLSGSLPYSLNGLAKLQRFIFYGNHFTGTLPGNIGACTNLVELHAGNNQLDGNVPDVFGNLTSLSFLNLSGNLFNGPLPPSLNSTVLTQMYFNDNQFSGNLPDYSALVNLKEINFNNNLLTGTIPSYLGSLPALGYLNLGTNQFVGSIPIELGNDPLLGWLDLSNNQLSGGIPKELGNLSQLSILFLSNNQLTGTLPHELGNCANLGDLVINNNQLTGKIPSTYSNFTKLYWVSLSHNSFTDSIPTTWASNAQLTNLFLDHNKFTYVPDCSALPQLIIVSLDNNALTFESIEPYYKVKSKFTAGFTYFPQDSTGLKQNLLLRPQCPFNVLTKVGGTKNDYQWYKDGSLISGATSATFNLPAIAAANAGSYTCSVTNTLVGGLTITTRPVALAVNAPLTVTVNPAPGVVCNQALLVVTPSGLPNYQWYEDGKKIVGAQNDSLLVYYDGNYTVQYQPDAVSSCKLVTPAFATTNLYIDNQPVIVSMGTPITKLSTSYAAVSFQWYVNDKLIVHTDTAALSVWYNGIYYLVARLANGCQYRSNTITVNESRYTNLGRLGDEGDTVRLTPPDRALTIYPNPAKGIITIDTGPFTAHRMEVFDNAGQLVFKKEFEGSTNILQVDVSAWSSGVYVVSIWCDEKRIWQKLVKY